MRANETQEEGHKFDPKNPFFTVDYSTLQKERQEEEDMLIAMGVEDGFSVRTAGSDCRASLNRRPIIVRPPSVQLSYKQGLGPGLSFLFEGTRRSVGRRPDRGSGPSSR
jgi:hypothetical protein